MKIDLIVGTREEDTIPPTYWPNAGQLVYDVRKRLQRNMVSNNPEVVTVLLMMHRFGEIELNPIYHRPSNRHITVDVKGEFIEPWPDEFFENTFYVRFTDKNLF